MVGQEWQRESCEEVVRLMSTDLFAFTLLWGINNRCQFFSLSFLHLPFPLLFVCLFVIACVRLLVPPLKMRVLNQCCVNPLTLMSSQPPLSLRLSVYPSSSSFFCSVSLQQYSGEQEKSLTLPWQLLSFSINKCFCTKYSISICMNDHTGVSKPHKIYNACDHYWKSFRFAFFSFHTKLYY